MLLGFHPKISLPTRLGNNSHSLIDNIFTNNKNLDECSSILLCDISDHLPACVITRPFIINMYISQNIRVKWNDCISHDYAVSYGVKQGSVMSSLLFNLYVQDLIECLDRKRLGCHMGNHFSGCFIFADDITLVAPSADALNAMLKVCELYAGEHDITFNSNKTKLMHFTMINQSLLDLSNLW